MSMSRVGLWSEPVNHLDDLEAENPCGIHAMN